MRRGGGEGVPERPVRRLTVMGRALARTSAVLPLALRHRRPRRHARSRISPDVQDLLDAGDRLPVAIDDRDLEPRKDLVRSIGAAPDLLNARIGQLYSRSRCRARAGRTLSTPTCPRRRSPGRGASSA